MRKIPHHTNFIPLPSSSQEKYNVHNNKISLVCLVTFCTWSKQMCVSECCFLLLLYIKVKLLRNMAIWLKAL